MVPAQGHAAMSPVEGSKAALRRAVDQAARNAWLLRDAQRQQATREARLPWQFRDPQLANAAWIAAEVRATMAAHREIDPALLRAAQAGELRRANTRAGTAEREAVYRANYLARRAAAPERSAREALGHRPPEVVIPPITALVDLPGGIGYVQLEGLRRVERQRIGRHDSLIRQLDRGRISPAAFRRRVRRWAPVGGYQLASDPAAILAAVDARRQAGESLGPYPEGGA